MSFFRYPGGKSKLKKVILEKIESLVVAPNSQYREPFFGGGSIGLELLTNKKISQFWINDKDFGLNCLWTSIILYPEELKEKVLQFVPSVKSFYEIKNDLIHHSLSPQTDVVEDIVSVGFKKLAIHQISYSGLGTKSGGPLGGVNQSSDYKIDCRWSPRYICKKIDRIHKLFSEMKSVECTDFDFVDLIRAPGDNCIIYLDPPYYKKGADLYQFFFTEDDHKRLSLALQETKHSWVLSYDDCEEIRKLYSWAKITELSVNYSITALKDKETGERLSRTKSELLITR